MRQENWHLYVSWQPSLRQELNLSDALSPQVPVLILFENAFIYLRGMLKYLGQSEKNPGESFLSFHYHVGPGARTQIIGLSSKRLCQLSLISLGLRICSCAFHKPWS